MPSSCKELAKDFVKNSKDTETKAIMRKAQTPLEVINAVKMLKV